MKAIFGNNLNSSLKGLTSEVYHNVFYQYTIAIYSMTGLLKVVLTLRFYYIFNLKMIP